MDSTTAKKIKTTTIVFELPQKLGILQYVEYTPEKQCVFNGCLYEGVLTAEGCRRGVCVRYRVWVHSRDRRKWEAKEKWRRQKDEEIGGCLRQQVADALWELSGQYDVGVWYEYRNVCHTCRDMTLNDCGVAINGVRLGRPYCHTVEDCVERILKYYRRAVETLKEPPERAKEDDVAKFLAEYPELLVFGKKWVEDWLPYARERMIQIATVLRKHTKLKKIIEKIGIKENPYVIEVFISSDETEECIAFNTEVYCISEEKVRKASLDYIGLIKPRGLMAFVKRSEFIRIV